MSDEPNPRIPIRVISELEVVNAGLLDAVERLNETIERQSTAIARLLDVAKAASEYREISESGSNVTASVWRQLTTALDTLSSTYQPPTPDPSLSYWPPPEPRRRWWQGSFRMGAFARDGCPVCHWQVGHPSDCPNR